MAEVVAWTAIVLGVVTVGLLAWILMRKPTSSDGKAAKMETEAEGLPAPEPSLALTELQFHEALDLTTYTRTMAEQARASFEKGDQAYRRVFIDGIIRDHPDLDGLSEVANLGLQTANLAHQIVRLKDGTRWSVILPKKAAQLYRAGKADWVVAQGKRLPILRDMDGKFVAHARIQDLTKTAQVAQTTRAVAQTTVNAAYLITSVDTLQRLKAIDWKVEYLAATNQFQQMARLEAIYAHAREALASNDHDRTRRLLDMRRDLHELRSAWAQEVVWRLDRQTDPHESKVKNLVVPEARRDREVLTTVETVQNELALVQLTLLMDLELAAATGTLEIFTTLTMPTEILRLEGLAQAYRAAALKVKDPQRRAPLSELAQGLQGTADQFRPILPEVIDHETRTITPVIVPTP